MAKELFDGARMASTLNTLEGYYDNLYSAMQNMDLAVNVNLNVTSSSASYGKKAKEVLDLWNDNCSVFKNYYYVFKELSSSIIKVFENNADFESTYQFNQETKVSYGEIVSSLDIVMSLQDARKVAAIMAGSLVVDGVAIKGERISDTKEKIVIGDKTYIIENDKEGNVISVTDLETNEIKKFEVGSIESQIQNMYDLYLEGKISSEDWEKYCDSLTNEEKGFLDCIMTNAFVVAKTDATSIIDEVNDSHYLPLLSSNHTREDFINDKESLFTENLYELYVLADYKRALEVDMETAEIAYDDGYISKETYDLIVVTNTSKMELIEKQIGVRAILNNELLSSESTSYSEILAAIDNGDIDLANQYILQLNASTSGFISLDKMLSENSLIGDNVVVDLYANRGGMRNFGVYEEAASVSGATSIKQTTFMGAYDYAVNTGQTYVDSSFSDVVYFSSYDYIAYGDVYFISTNYMVNERDYLSYVNSFSVDGVPNVKMDSVYIKSLNMYCTVDQFNEYVDSGILIKGEDGLIKLGEKNE